MLYGTLRACLPARELVGGFYCVRGEVCIVDVDVFGCTGVVGCAFDSVAIAFSSAGVPIFRAHNLIDDAEPSSPRGLQALTTM